MRYLESCNITITDSCVSLNNTNINEAARDWIRNETYPETDQYSGLFPIDKFGDIAEWDTSDVTQLAETFKNQPDFNADISRWDVSIVTNFTSVFEGAITFDVNISKWDVSSATTMIRSFSGAEAFVGTSPNTGKMSYLNPWDTRLVGPDQMVEIFGNNPDHEKLCGNEWILSAPAGSANVKLVTTQILNTRSICHCRAGTFYQIRATLNGIEGCSPCQDQLYSEAGNTAEAGSDTCKPCNSLSRDFYCGRGEKIPCPDIAGLACYQGEIIPVLGQWLNETNEEINECPRGYYCPGNDIVDGLLPRFPCKPGTFNNKTGASMCEPCSRGAIAPAFESEQCTECPPGTFENASIVCVKCEPGQRSISYSEITCTVCEPGTYAQFEGETGCKDCPSRGVNCFERKGGEVAMEENFWRFNDSLPVEPYTQFYACDTCEVDAETFRFTCPEGHDLSTPVCGSCIEGYWMNSNNCVLCEDSGNDFFWACFGIAVMCMLFAVALYQRKIREHWKVISNQLGYHRIFVERIVVVVQVLVALEDVYRLDESGGYPTNYANFIQNVGLQLFSLDFLNGFSCVMDYNFYGELLGKTIPPTAAILLIWLKIRCFGPSKTLETIAYYICTLSLVPVSTVVFRTFACTTFQFEYDEDSGIFATESRLRADLTLNCDLPEHKAYLLYAVFMMLIYPIGVPFMAMVIMQRKKAQISDYLGKCDPTPRRLWVEDEFRKCVEDRGSRAFSTAETYEKKRKLGFAWEKTNQETRDAYEKLAHIASQNVAPQLDLPDDIERFKNLFVHFRPEYEWWGVYDILNRLVITGFAVLIVPGSMMQIVMAVFVSFTFFSAQIIWHPYRDTYQNFITAFVNLEIMATVFASYLIKIDNEVGTNIDYEAGYDLESIGLVLIVVNSVIFVEVVRYVKSAFEFSTSVVIVDVEGPRNFNEGKKGVAPWLWHQGTLRREKGDATNTDNAKQELGEYVKRAAVFLESLSDEEIKDKVPSEKKDALAEKINEARGLCDGRHCDVKVFFSRTSSQHEKNVECTAMELIKVQQELESIATSIIEKISLGGSYFPLDEQLQPYPQMSVFKQLFDLVYIPPSTDPLLLPGARIVYKGSRGTLAALNKDGSVDLIMEDDREIDNVPVPASWKVIAWEDVDDLMKGIDELTLICLAQKKYYPGVIEQKDPSKRPPLWWRVLWWRKDVYANDTSGWIIRRTERGWEIVPYMTWEKGALYETLGGFSLHPPSTGWRQVRGAAAKLSTRSPFRCCGESAPDQLPDREQSLLDNQYSSDHEETSVHIWAKNNVGRAHSSRSPSELPQVHNESLEMAPRRRCATKVDDALFEELDEGEMAELTSINLKIQTLKQQMSTREKNARDTNQRLEEDAERLEKENAELRRENEIIEKETAKFENDILVANREAEEWQTSNDLLKKAKSELEERKKSQEQEFKDTAAKFELEANLRAQAFEKEKEQLLAEMAVLKSEKARRAEAKGEVEGD